MKEAADTAENADAGAELASLVEQVQQGDVQAYTGIIEQFQRPIYLYCYYLLGSREEAEDAVQDIFLKALEHIRRFSPRVSFSAWLYTIARNHCTDLLKKRNRSYKLFMLYKKQQAEPDGSALGLTEQVQGLLARLNGGERQILLLRALENYSYEQIGSILEMNPARVRKKYERLRKKLGRHTEKRGVTLGEPRSHRG
jgi:RNA polymerase sigma-70 factor (ECF subfamily)